MRESCQTEKLPTFANVEFEKLVRRSYCKLITEIFIAALI